MQVLIVDDSVSARFSLKRSLERFGISVEAASSAEDGIALLGTTQFEAIFMDHVLPQMDGLEAVTVIRRMDAYRTTPIIMCSSNDDAEYIERAMNAGANSVIRKPPEPEQLETVVAALRGGRMVPTLDEPAPDFSTTQEVPTAEQTAPGVEFSEPEPEATPTAHAFDEPEWMPESEPAATPAFSAAEPSWGPEAEPEVAEAPEAETPEIIITEADYAQDEPEAEERDSGPTVLSTTAHVASGEYVDVPDSHRVEVKVDTRELKRLVTQLDGISQRLASAEQTLQRIDQLTSTLDRLDALEQSLTRALDALPSQIGEAARATLAARLQAAAAALTGAPDADA